MRTSRPRTRWAYVSSGKTTIASSGATASFSVAIASSVSPRTSVCSSPTFVEQDDTRAQDVRRVVAAAETRLDHGGVNLCIREGCQRCRGHDLELRRAELLRRRADPSDGSFEVGLGAVHPDSLAPGRNVWRDRRADGESLREQELLDGHRRGRLSVRTDDVDRWIRVLRVPSAASSARIRSTPKPSRGQGLIASSQSTALIPIVERPLDALSLLERSTSSESIHAGGVGWAQNRSDAPVAASSWPPSPGSPIGVRGSDAADDPLTAGPGVPLQRRGDRRDDVGSPR